MHILRAVVAAPFYHLVYCRRGAASVKLPTRPGHETCLCKRDLDANEQLPRTRLAWGFSVSLGVMSAICLALLTSTKTVSL